MSLPTGWSTLLDNPQGCLPYIEAIIDPDGEAITLDEENGLVAMTDIQGGIEIDPDYNDFFLIRDLQLSFADFNQLFSTFSTRSNAVRVISRVLGEDPKVNNPCDLRDGVGDFEIGDTVYFTDGNNIENRVLTSASSSSIGWASTLTNNYAEGSVVATLPLTGKICEIKLYLDGNANSLTIFKGVIKEGFKWDGKNAILKLTNHLVRVLDLDLKIVTTTNATDYLDNSGNYVSSFHWSSGATTTLSGVTVYADCPVGQWTIVIGAGSGSSYAYTLTDPDGNEYLGQTDQNIYTHTDSSDSFLYIPAANWGGTIAEGDVLAFRTAVNIQNKTIVEMIYDLLVNYTNSELSSSDIDVGGTGVTDGTELGYSFNKLYDLTSDRTFHVTFDRKCKVIEAILAILPHEIAAIGQMLNGNIRIFSFHPDFYMNNLTPKVIGNPQVDRSELYNEFKVWFRWDHADGVDEYDGAWYVYPESDEENPSYKIHGKKRDCEIFCPLFID